ncbi:MAG: hypothetical protein LBV08_02290 [Clostridiales bacterium]|jgi:hypothetical protein|nr:hypothetical protein [Clostridiales bacterium]
MKKNNRVAIPIILLLALMAVAAYFAYAPHANGAGKAFGGANIVSIPAITSSVASSVDNTSHNFKVEFYLEFPPGDNLPMEAKNAIHDNMQSVVSKLDYGRINKADGYEYVKESISNYLASNNYEYTEIYITTLQADNAIIADSPKFKNNRQEEIFKALFQNM